MEPASPFSSRDFYPEREELPEPAVDRILAGLSFRYRHFFHREPRHPVALAADVSHHAARFARQPLASHLSELRYRLSRDGLVPHLIVESLGLCCAAMSSNGAPAPMHQALTAAIVLLQDGVAELADADARRQALVLAAVTRAIQGIPVHVFSASDAGSGRTAHALRVPLEALGMQVGCIAAGMDQRARRTTYAMPVVCGTQREIAIDYLRDRLQLGGKPRPLAGMLERLSIGGIGAQLLLRGLHCALVDEADVVLLDDAHWPLAISAQTEHSAERLLYEQALELARALASGADYEQSDSGARLTEEGARRTARLIGSLGGAWAARQRREELITLALDALNRFQQGTDYQVKQGRVVLLGRGEPGAEEPSETDQILQHLIEVKEGCRLSGRHDVLVRLSLPRFFRRYLRLSGVCGDARGVEQEFWTMYSMATTRTGSPADAPDCSPRVFLTTADKRRMLLARVQDCITQGESVVVAIRTQAEAQAMIAALTDAGLRPGLITGAGDEAERLAVAGLGAAGTITLVLYPANRRIEGAGPGRVRTNLFVAELHDAKRHVDGMVRLLAPDSCEMLLSLEDETVVSRISPAWVIAARLGGAIEGELSPRRSNWLARLAQRAAEGAGAMLRKELMSRDQYLNDLLAFSGRRE